MLIESQTVFPGFDFRLEGTVLFLLNPTAVTQPNLSVYQDTLSGDCQLEKSNFLLRVLCRLQGH